MSVQGEADVRPGTVVLSNPAVAGLCRWSGERLDPAALLKLSIFLREQDVPGEGDFIGPQVGTMLHARRMGWNFTSGKES